MEPCFLSLVGLNWDPPPAPKHMRPTHPPFRVRRDAVEREVGNAAPPRHRSPAARRGGARPLPRLTPGLRGRRSTRERYPPEPGDGRVPASSAGPRCWEPRPRPPRGRRRATREAEPRGRSHKVTNPEQGGERASGRPGRSLERVYLRTLPAERARNGRISSEAANICRREKEAEPGRAARRPSPRSRGAGLGGPGLAAPD